MSFSELGLSAPLLAAVAKNEYAEPYPIQIAAIPAILAGKDVLGIAQTGSGKTAGFVLPILQQFQKKKVAKNRFIKALILVPTRELAVQVGAVFAAFSLDLPRPVKTLAVFGGVSINPQMMHLYGVEILVATPGRLLDLLDSKAMDLSEVDILVLDEADKMLNLGFKEEMDRILHLLPLKRQNLLFSATLGKDIDTLKEIILHDPVKIEIEQEVENLDLIKLSGYRVSEDRKGPLLRYLIKENDWKQVLVFTSSIHKADSIVHKLKTNGIKALALHSQKSQGARTEALRYLKSGEINVLVATDLASRGIDIPSLPTVINYELPRSPKDFIHRIGRTGRAGVPGAAISFVSADDELHFRVIQKKTGRWVDMIESEGLNLKGY
ncbi:MAG: DEAD/DEAH box helicase [Saprospiraceae bacterium]|nr:DEAD/DEAH box helicase [Saprospiraceae bacterium]MDZ4705357.1 DEAD/DEAH box helicase [Saprospiraceae bacterium]